MTNTIQLIIFKQNAILWNLVGESIDLIINYKFFCEKLTKS